MRSARGFPQTCICLWKTSVAGVLLRALVGAGVCGEVFVRRLRSYFAAMAA